jgi:hyperosmotically inducible protein
MLSNRYARFVLPLALAAAVAAPGCMSTRPASVQVDDASITAKVKSALAADATTNPLRVDVDTQEGVVRLSGTVEDPANRRRAEEVARNVEGVRRVVNDIQVGDKTVGQSVDDKFITTKIKSKLTVSGDLNPFNIDVDTVNGVVTLSGRVAKPEAKAEAERLARETEGVREVRNNIQVGEI